MELESARGRTIWIADGHREGKRFVVRADEKLTAFVELESATRASKTKMFVELSFGKPAKWLRPTSLAPFRL